MFILLSWHTGERLKSRYSHFGSVVLSRPGKRSSSASDQPGWLSDTAEDFCIEGHGQNMAVACSYCTYLQRPLHGQEDGLVRLA